MPLVRNVEKRIWNIEHFEVVIKHPALRDTRGYKNEVPMYPFDSAAKNSMTVSAWKERRFTQTILTWTLMSWTRLVSRCSRRRRPSISYSLNSFSSALASFRSAVSKPSVNQL